MRQVLNIWYLLRPRYVCYVFDKLVEFDAILKGKYRYIQISQISFLIKKLSQKLE